MSYVKNLSNKGFNAADIHYFSRYFNITIRIKDPFETNLEGIIRIKEEVEYNDKANSLSLNGSNKQIEKIIELGKIGVIYEKDLHNKILTEY